MKPNLLVVELWGMGDLVIATPFLQAATEKFTVTLLAKPYAQQLQPRLWPTVNVIPFDAPWTVFSGKYRLWQWPWPTMKALRAQLVATRFDYAVSARWDPRDHFMLKFSGAEKRLGFPRLRSHRLLTHPLPKPEPAAHHYDYWRAVGHELGLALPGRQDLRFPPPPTDGTVLVHSGARLAARMWPLPHYADLVRRLRQAGHPVQVACDPGQLSWWQQQNETAVACPQTVPALLQLIDQASCFIGNCSGPGHLAAICGRPTLTLFGPSMSEWFLPLHPLAQAVEGRTCPYKPCADYCRFPTPRCIQDLSVDHVWPHAQRFAATHTTTQTRQLA